jgi:hypothetical protein
MNDFKKDSIELALDAHLKGHQANEEKLCREMKKKMQMSKALKAIVIIMWFGLFSVKNILTMFQDYG